MIQWDKHIKIWQLVGAVLAVPAGVAGTYGVFHNYLSDGVSCPQLKSSIIATLERNISAEAKRALLQETVAQFDKRCGDTDPDARVVFDAATSPRQISAAPPSAAAGAAPLAIFGLSKTGEKRGWVAMIRRDAERNEQANFDADGIPVSSKSPPQIGVLLSARQVVPVWLDPQVNDRALLQGRIAVGTCVRVLSMRPATPRLWAEVAPETCK